MILLSRACVSPYYYYIETMSVSRTGSKGRSRSLKMALFDRLYTTFCWLAIVSIALYCTIFELFDVE